MRRGAAILVSRVGEAEGSRAARRRARLRRLRARPGGSAGRAERRPGAAAGADRLGGGAAPRGTARRPPAGGDCGLPRQLLSSGAARGRRKGLERAPAALALVRDSARGGAPAAGPAAGGARTRGIEPGAALLRADLGRDRALAALAVRDLIGRGLSVVVAKRPLAWVPSRRALFGALPRGATGGLSPRLLRRLGVVERLWCRHDRRRGGSAVLAGEDGQVLPLALGGCFVLIAGALALVAIAGAVTGKGRVQRAADLAAISAARSMRDDLPRLLSPPTLPNGLPNPAHMEKAGLPLEGAGGGLLGGEGERGRSRSPAGRLSGHALLRAGPGAGDGPRRADGGVGAAAGLGLGRRRSGGAARRVLRRGDAGGRQRRRLFGGRSSTATASLRRNCFRLSQAVGGQAAASISRHSRRLPVRLPPALSSSYRRSARRAPGRVTQDER